MNTKLLLGLGLLAGGMVFVRGSSGQWNPFAVQYMGKSDDVANKVIPASVLALSGFLLYSGMKR